MGVRGMPVGEGHGVGEQTGVPIVQQRTHLTQAQRPSPELRGVRRDGCGVRNALLVHTEEELRLAHPR